MMQKYLEYLSKDEPPKRDVKISNKITGKAGEVRIGNYAVESGGGKPVNKKGIVVGLLVLVFIVFIAIVIIYWAVLFYDAVQDPFAETPGIGRLILPSLHS